MPGSEPALPSRAPAYLIAGLIHASAMLLAFPPLGLWGFTFVAPLQLIWAGWARGRGLTKFGRRAQLGRGPLMVAIGALPLQIYAHQWILDVSAAGYIPMVVAMAGFTGTLVWVLSVLTRRWQRIPLAIVAPVVWTAVE